MTRPVVIVFSRIPRLGVGKRRLARLIGDRAALRASRTLLRRLVTRLRPMRGVQRVIAATPDHHVKFYAPGWHKTAQGRGDLGRRMQRAFRRFQRRPVVLIGSDIPGITEADIRLACLRLRGHHAVFGPAVDGGYWLIGLAGPRRLAVFDHVRWSTPEALADTVKNLAGQRIAMLRTLRDIDEAL